MGNVLIIKNNSKSSDIYNWAKESFENNKKGYYNTLNGSPNEMYLKKVKQNFDGNGIVLFLTYDGTQTELINDVFIGSEVMITEQNNIVYTMKIHLERKWHKRAIESIIDKIDLDINKDFDLGCYVIMSNMESLFQELRERLVANKTLDLEFQKIESRSCEESYVPNVLAQKDQQAVRIYPSDDVGSYRTEFQRDRERVVNCKAFRRLVDKAQIFSAEKGDYYRTRMTHSLEVNQIAKAIAYALKLNLDLTEAIALGHDLGHTPFGHQGERTLDEILCGKQKIGIEASDKLLEERCFGGFKHNYQSARILAQLEEKYVEYPGLNVSVQVIEGVLKHTKIKPKQIKLEDFLSQDYLEEMTIDDVSEMQVCSSLEGQVVAVADEIAQRGHDVDDALTSGVMSIDEFLDRLKIDKCNQLETKIVNEINKIDETTRLVMDKKELQIARIVSCIVNYFITTTIEHSMKKINSNASMGEITLSNQVRMVEFSPEVEKVNSYLERVVQKKVICNNEVARADYNASMIVKKLFEKYYSNPRLLHSGTIHKIFVETLMHENKSVSNSAINLNDGSIKLVNEEIKEITTEPIDEEMIMEYLQNIDYTRTEKDIIIFEKRKILLRAITDYIAGMTDGYALEEFSKLK
ncbi:MAG: dNTP triphosphohydrolase [Lachnospiraceae bacterium]|nr:dNTP triphosphohydrolase [Lachnospiraceae bacterium]